ncbi:hypothetical protein A3K93_04485 [Acinetobacter sp. NCu2D-2]|uniref:DUF58 domain-containing protein n=1 Tax=Acinetobacter sp. NCu2D-2 TaxID=1608473 RepID=UPI0007CE0A53|nr:DUF58 domain-containing protein [Acinetobacter sp. NCu2D-2]ANF81519.1 hypothetical protein A3K93_04485 [Acinetobacter sp. NCu2D-2]
MRNIWQGWLKKRFRFQDTKTLKQKDVLIFIYQQGYLFIFLILITFIAGVNYANNLILGFCFLISAVLCMSFYLTFKQLHGLEIELVADELGQVGQSLHLQLYFKQKNIQPRFLYIEYEDQLEKIYLNALVQRCDIKILAKERGLFKYPNLKIYSVYPFGLVRAWTYLFHHAQAWIAPKAEMNDIEHHQASDHFHADMDEYRELRNYQLGDSLQAVSWKQVARGQGLYIKVFEQHQDDHRVEIDYAYMPSQSHELILQQMMGVIERCEQQNIEYKLILPKAELDYACGEQQLNKAKLLLAQA